MFTTLQQHRRRRQRQRQREIESERAPLHWGSVHFLRLALDSAWPKGMFSGFLTERWHQTAPLEALALFDGVPDWGKWTGAFRGGLCWRAVAENRNLWNVAVVYICRFPHSGTEWCPAAPTVSWANGEASVAGFCSSVLEEHLLHATATATSSHLMNFGEWHL